MVSQTPRRPSLGRLRMATLEDAPTVMTLVIESMAKNFRINNASDVEYLIENCILSICQLDEDGTIVGFLAAKDYPLIPSVHPRAWEEYIWLKYKAIELTARNTLFLHLLCWDTSYGRGLVQNMLKSMFMHDPYLHYIAMLKSLRHYPQLVPGQSGVESLFRRVSASERGVAGDLLPGLLIAERTEISPRLRIRRAVEEDNDDIVPIIERHSSRLKQLYGEFYISEIISRHPESERVLLVCEHKELAVGVLALNTQINYEALEQSYDLSAFSGLRRVVESRRFTDMAKSSAGQVGNPSFSDIELNEKSNDTKSGVTWLFNDTELMELQSESSLTPSTSQIYDLDILNLLDEEELEYEIVNIDPNLLKVPKTIYDSERLTDSANKPLEKSSDIDYHKDRGSSRKSRLSMTPSKSKPSVPSRYVGAPNAFLLELFAMHPDYDERYGFDMLEAAFELFPGRDYCVMCIQSHHPSFPLLEHFTLVTPYNTQMRFMNETLYVAHINSVRGYVEVRPGEASDVKYVGDIVARAPRAQALTKLYESSLTTRTLHPFILLSEKQPIGMVVLGPLLESIAIRTQYNLEPEPRRTDTDGHVLAAVMSPALEPHSRWYMRELIRQSRYTTLFWTCKLFAKGDEGAKRNLMSLAGHMMPVRPRRYAPDVSNNKDLVFQDLATPFAVWVLERPLTWLPKVYVNNSIVVVGASRTGLSFLETLIMGPASQYLTFSNLTLISDLALPTTGECLKAAEICVPQVGSYSDRYLKSLPFYFYVDVVTDVMVDIDRKAKCIHLKSGGVKFYDELVFTFGKQFQHPNYLRESLELDKEMQKGKPCDRLLMDNPEYKPDRVPTPLDVPENLMLINSLQEANTALNKILLMITEAEDTNLSLREDYQIVVYGRCTEAYNCLAALLDLGLSPQVLTFVEPFPPEEPTELRVNCFNNETVDQRVQASIERLGIRVFRRYFLAGWRQVDSRIEAIQLMGPLHAVVLPTFAIFYYGIRDINLNAFRVLNQSGVVYDGGIVVGPSFETNDPHIFAAGPCTRYSRRLYASHLKHEYYRSEEVGDALAKIFLLKMDPFVMCDPEIQKELVTSEVVPSRTSRLLSWEPVMEFKSPIVKYSVLPGPTYYMTVRKPGPILPMAVKLCLPQQGHTLITDKHGNYFRLQLNALHCINAVTCLSKKPFAHDVLDQLYGKHEGFFNKLLARYQMGEIEDLFDYFSQPWLAALFQESFGNVLQAINEHDLGTVYDLPNTQLSRAAMKHQCAYTDADSETCEMGCKNLRNLGTIRSVIDDFVARTSSQMECGQSELVRGEAASFWRTLGGDHIVTTHLSHYLSRYSLINQHYAKVKQVD